MTKLFSPMNVGALELGHRVIFPGFAPTAHRPLSRVDPMTVDDYERCASMGGLIVSEPAQISIQGSDSAVARGLYEQNDLAEWSEIASRVHARGGLILAQLSHAGRIAHSSINIGGPVGPSDIPSGQKVASSNWQLVDSEIPQSLDQRGIDAVILDYRSAAENARLANFDGVELNGADGYLPDQFLQDTINTRDDRYGGTIKNRVHFLAEVAGTLGSVWGFDRIGVRLSPFGTLNDVGDSNSMDLFTQAMRTLYDLDAAYVHLVRTDENGRRRGHLDLKYSDAAKLRAAFPGFLIASGNYTKLEAIDIVDRRWADAVGSTDPSFDD
jgi:N-ethylmaleimide reductase